MPPYFIEIKGLEYTYPQSGDCRVLEGVDLNIERDEYLLLCAASGSGKSTLCRTFNGLIPHFYKGTFAGSVKIAGLETTTETVAGLFARVGMVFQNPDAQLFSRTVEGEIAFGLESLGLPRDEIRARIGKVVDRVRIGHLLPRSPHELSGGEQQLVSIAAILALQPQIIVLDEPYANLDPSNVSRVRTVLAEIHRRGTGIIISEHRLPLTASDAQRIVVLHNGRVVLDGPPGEVLRDNIETYGIEMPLAVRASKHIQQLPVALNLEELSDDLSALPEAFVNIQPQAPSAEAASVLAFENLSFEKEGRRILADIQFHLRRGECLAIVGANGAGKTTLLKHANGLYRPSRGRVVVNGLDAERLKVSQLARYIGVAFQNPNSQFFKLTVWDEIVVGAKALDCYDEIWIKELVRLFRLESLLKRAPYRLSDGEKKRVAFAAALAARPLILALDEPTAGQDLFFRSALEDLLRRLCSQGQAVLLVTQDLSFAERCAHRWLLMAKGRVVADGRPQAVMADESAMQAARLEPTDSFRLAAMLSKGRRGEISG